MNNRLLRVFLCHSSRDKKYVREIYLLLKKENWIDPWLDEEKLLPGQDWHAEVEKAVEFADVVIVFLSKHSVSQEGFVQRELKLALDIADEKAEETIYIVPLRLDDCPTPRRLRGWQYVDYFPDERKQWAYHRLNLSLLKKKEQLDQNAYSVLMGSQEDKSLNPLTVDNNSRSINDSKLTTLGLGDLIQTSLAKPLSVEDSKEQYNADIVNLDSKKQQELQPQLKGSKKNEITKKNLDKAENKPKVSIKKKTYKEIPEKYKIGNIDFIKIPSGEFLMGSDFMNGARPQRSVSIAYNYWISVYPIVNFQYAKFIKSRVNDAEFGDHPVVNVSWLDAIAYVNWLNKTFIKELPIRYKFRLPSESEWEKAARGTDGRLYPWGNKHYAYSNSSGSNIGTTSVFAYSPQGDSPYGVADMVGNVWEWTRSTWRFLDDSDAELEKYFSMERIVRGGSFNDNEVVASCPTRQRFPSNTVASNLGFRIVISTIEKK